MRKWIGFIALVLVFVCCGVTLTGCGVENLEPVNIAFVVAIADGESLLEEFDELSELPSRPGTTYAFISPESNPVCIGEKGTVADVSDRGYTEVMMNRVREGIKADLTERLTSYKPSSPEIDIAAATEYAVRTLNAEKVEGRKNILVFHCGGKSTYGLINMIETPIGRLDIDASVSTVAEKMHVDMSSVDQVIFYGCGDYNGEKQASLSSDEVARMKEFYNKLFTALGANDVKFREDLSAEDCYRFDDVPVSQMPVSQVVSDLVELDTADLDNDILSKPIAITEKEVAFIGDTSEYLYPDKAIATLQPLADYLKDRSDTVALFGTTAGDADSDYTMSLSMERALAVKETLCELGVDGDRIIAKGLGSTKNPWHIYNAGFDSEDASKNRAVVVMDARSELAFSLLSGEDD